MQLRLAIPATVANTVFFFSFERFMGVLFNYFILINKEQIVLI